MYEPVPWKPSWFSLSQFTANKFWDTSFDLLCWRQWKLKIPVFEYFCNNHGSPLALPFWKCSLLQIHELCEFYNLQLKTLCSLNVRLGTNSKLVNNTIMFETFGCKNNVQGLMQLTPLKDSCQGNCYYVAGCHIIIWLESVHQHKRHHQLCAWNWHYSAAAEQWQTCNSFTPSYYHTLLANVHCMQCLTHHVATMQVILEINSWFRHIRKQ